MSELSTWVEATAMNVDRCLAEWRNTGFESCVEDANLYAETLVALTQELRNRLLTK